MHVVDDGMTERRSGENESIETRQDLLEGFQRHKQMWVLFSIRLTAKQQVTGLAESVAKFGPRFGGRERNTMDPRMQTGQGECGSSLGIQGTRQEEKGESVKSLS